MLLLFQVGRILTRETVMQHVEPADPSKTPPASTLEKVGGANLEQILRSAGTLSSSTISEPIHTLPDPVIYRLDRSSTSISGMSFTTDTDYSDHSSDPCLSTIGTASPATSFASYTYTPPRLIPSAFEMWVSRETDLSGPFGDCTHIYTSMCREDSLQQVPVPLMSLPAWASRFPHVAELHENHQLAPECAILHFNVSVSTMPAPPPPNSVLCTQFEITVPAGHPSSAHYDVRTWECITRIYTPGKKVWELCHTVLVADDFTGAPGNRKLTLPFASDFWSAFYANLANDQQLLGHDNAGKKRREREEKSAIKGVTVVQELFSYRSEGLESIKERAALILFDFSKTEGQQHPQAVWREITSPVSELCSLTPAHLTPELQTVHPSFLSVDNASRWQEESVKCDIPLYDDMITPLDTEALQNYGSYFRPYETLYVDNQHEQFQQEHQQHTTISPVDIFYQNPAQYEQAYIPMEEERYLSVMESMDDSGF